MNKTFVAYALGFVALILIIIFLSSGSRTEKASQDQQATTTPTQTTNSPSVSNTGTPAPTAPTKTFRSIFTQSGSHECLYQQVGASSQTKSAIYIADGKMRGEFRTISGTESDVTLMVYDHGYLYTWKEGATTGKRTSITSVSDLPQAIPSDLTSGAVLGTNTNSVGWDCHNWIKDSSLLAPPSYVKFQ